MQISQSRSRWRTRLMTLMALGDGGKTCNFMGLLLRSSIGSVDLQSACGRGAGSKRVEKPLPTHLRVEGAPHLVATCPVEVEAAMLELDARGVPALGDEADLHFGLEIRVVLPLG